jgi:hypothetical protein
VATVPNAKRRNSTFTAARHRYFTRPKVNGKLLSCRRIVRLYIFDGSG